MNKKIFLPALAGISMLLVGCNDDTTNVTSSGTTVTGVDGYIVGATVQDKNGNSALANSDGTYVFAQAPAYPISLTGGTLLDTGDNFTGDLITGTGDADMYAPSGLVISPITTLLTTITNNQATATLNSALSVKLAAMLGVSEADLLTDFVASENLAMAKTTQALHLMQQDPSLFAAFKTELLAETGTGYAGVSTAAIRTMTAENAAGDLSDIKQTVYTEILNDVSAYTGTVAALEAGIDGNKSILENIAAIEALGGDIGNDIASLQTALALAEIAGSGDSTKSLTTAQLTTLGATSVVTDSADLTALMIDVIRQTGLDGVGNKIDTVAELQAIESALVNFNLVDTQQGSAVTSLQLLAAYNTILALDPEIEVTDYRQTLLAALTNTDAAVTANTVAQVQALFDGLTLIAAPTLALTAVPLVENAGISQSIATAATTAATGSVLTATAYELDTSGDFALLTIDQATGAVSVNADPDFETKAAYTFTVKVTTSLTSDNTLTVGTDSQQITADITDALDLGIASIAYSYGAENSNAHAIGGTNSEADIATDNQLVVTFNAAIDESTLLSENFSIDDVALASGLTTAYSAATKELSITIGSTTIDIEGTNTAATSVITSSGVLLATGGAFDTGFDTVTVAARTGIVHNAITYNVVISPDTGKYWLDRNLGAAQVAIVFDDATSYGDLYQWGRPTDGHEKNIDSTPFNGELSLNGNSTTLDASIAPSINMFITNATTPFDWVASGVDDSGALRTSFMSKIDGSGICPTGFRTPTEAELVADTTGATTTVVGDSATAFSSFLKLPVAGYRDRSSGALTYVGSNGLVWSSAASGSYARSVGFSASAAGVNSNSRAYGFSVRCLQD